MAVIAATDAMPSSIFIILSVSFFLRRELQKFFVDIVHHAVCAKRVVVPPTIFKILPCIDWGIAPVGPFVVVGYHLRPQQGLYAQFGRRSVRAILLGAVTILIKLL